MSVLCIQYSGDCIRFVSDTWFTLPTGQHRNDLAKMFGNKRRIFSATGMVPHSIWLPGSFANALAAENFLMSFSEAIFKEATLSQLQAFQKRQGDIHSAWLAGVADDGQLFLRGIGLKLICAKPKHSYYRPELTATPQLVSSGGRRVQLSEHNDPITFVQAAITLGVDCGGPIQEMQIQKGR
jgi:hypothetical protein